MDMHTIVKKYFLTKYICFFRQWIYRKKPCKRREFAKKRKKEKAGWKPGFFLFWGGVVLKKVRHSLPPNV